MARGMIAIAAFDDTYHPHIRSHRGVAHPTLIGQF
jgi:hypothetical protein